LLSSKVSKALLRPGLRPRSRWGDYRAPQTLQLDFRKRGRERAGRSEMKKRKRFQARERKRKGQEKQGGRE